MIKQYNRVINLVNERLRDVAAVVLAFVVALVVANVILRIFNRAILGTYDLVVVLTPVAIALSIAYCAIKDGHVAITMLVERFPMKVQKIVNFITGSIAIVVFSMAVWYLVKHADTLRKNHEVTTTILFPFSPIILIIALGFAMLVLVLLGQVLNLFEKEGEQ